MDTKKTVMVVDDNPDIITIVSTILQAQGYTVVSASSGSQVFKLLQEIKPDLVILDIMLPEIDGLQVLTHLKQSPETSSIPVILLTVKGRYVDMVEGYKLGGDYYITKPFTPRQLLNGIRLVLGEPLREE